jgi:sigma-E factor negative regulatory protein RseB
MVRWVLILGLISFAGLSIAAETDNKSALSNQALTSEQQSLTAQGFYEQMLEMSPKAMYQGIFSHQAGNQVQNIEIVHGINNGDIWERMMHLDGPVREIIRRGEELFCIHPDASVEQLQKQGNAPFGNKSMGSIKQLNLAYNFKLLGGQRVAGRPVVGIQLTPKDATRHFYQVWLDKQTTVPLRTELIARNGQVLERYLFSYFKSDAQFDDRLFQPRNKGVELNMAESTEVLKASTADILEWRLNWMPIGFQDQTASGHAPKLSARRIYSDGVVMFSVYVEGVEKVQDEGTAQAGPTALAVQHKQWHGKTHRITVVGEIPAATAQRIAESVELR